MRFLARKPSQEKMRKGMRLIEALADQLHFYDDGGSSGGNIFQRYPNWRTDERDYAAVLNAARNAARRGFRYTIEAAGWGGMAGSQFMIVGSISKPGALDYGSILEKAAERLYKRMREQAPPQDEVNRIVLEFDRQSHEDLVKDLGDLRFRLWMMDKDEIRGRLAIKLRYYHQRRYTHSTV